jgi:hypothetical protein
MNSYFFVIICLLLSGCAAATATKTFTSDGKEGYVINCSGKGFADDHWGLCYEKAGEICGRKGYEIVEKIGEQDKSSGFSGDKFGIYGVHSTITHRNMIIKCKE